MSAITKILGVGIATTLLAAAAPSAAQYYPGDQNPNVPGPGYGYGAPPNAYGMNNEAMVGQCTNAVEARLNGAPGYGGYEGGPNGYGGGYGGYGGGPNGYGGGRVLGVSRVEPGREGGFTVRGVATSGYAGYGYAPNSPDLVWLCRTDFRGMVVDVHVERARSNYGHGNAPPNSGYSPYGYQRY